MQEISEEARLTMRAFLDVIALAEPMIAELWRSHQLTLGHVQALRFLKLQSELAGDLAKKMHVAPASLTRVLERLEQRKFITRAIDPTDRRRIVVTITPEGLDVLAGIKPWFASPVFAAIQALDTQSSTTVRQGLKILADQVDGMVRENQRCL